MSKLSAKQAENLSKPGTHDDGNGLRLIVKASGSKSWVLRYQLHGQRHDLGLGGYPQISLGVARKLALEKRGLISQGIDPLARKRSAKQSRQEQHFKNHTFSQCAEEYIDAHRSGWKNIKSAEQWASSLKSYAYPIIGKTPVGKVTTDDVLKILRPIWDDKHETARRVRNRIELVLDSARALGLSDGENPARLRGHLDKLLPKHSRSKNTNNHPAMPWAELPVFMIDLKAEQGHAARALEFTILTAGRTGEILKATWDEFDFKTKTWTIPANRMKAEQLHRVPLSQAALEILENQPRDSQYVFPGARPDKPLSDMAMMMVLRRMGKGGVVVHGFRSTFRVWAGECTKTPRDVCEHALAHRVGNAVEAAYNRSDLFEKRKTLMESWGVFVSSQFVGG